MSSVTIILILLINNIFRTISINQCDLLSAIDLQSATYCHSLILHVKPIHSSEGIVQNLITRKVLIREVIKISMNNSHKMKKNDIIIIRSNNDRNDSCWHLLRIENVNLILFLNQTNTNEFDLRYPPVELTPRVRENIHAVMNYETYAPQVMIKTPMDKPILSNNYSLRCNTRGNPIPRVLWSENNQIFEYYPTAKQCKTPCRIYSTQNKYQSVLYFQSFKNTDSGIYVCHAENIINHTTTSVYIDINESTIINRSDMNITCISLKSCHSRGQCVIVDNQLKCLCDDRYFGELCETNYDDIIKKQNNAFLLFKSRFLTSSIIIVISLILIFIAFISCYLARHNKTKKITKSTIPKAQVIEQKYQPEIRQTLSSPIARIVNNRSVITKDSSTTTDDDENSNGYCVSLNMNTNEEINFGTKTNHLILSEGYLEYYQPDAESGLIRPLSIQKDMSQCYTKYISSYDRFRLPRQINRQ